MCLHSKVGQRNQRQLLAAQLCLHNQGWHRSAPAQQEQTLCAKSGDDILDVITR